MPQPTFATFDDEQWTLVQLVVAQPDWNACYGGDGASLLVPEQISPIACWALVESEDGRLQRVIGLTTSAQPFGGLVACEEDAADFLGYRPPLRASMHVVPLSEEQVSLLMDARSAGPEADDDHG